MVVPAIGSVVLVTFPFSDLSQTKLRPAAVLAYAGRNDWILCQITSKPYSDPGAVSIITDDFQSGNLRATSYVRPGKLFTANQTLITREVGVLKAVSFSLIINAVIAILAPQTKEQTT